MGQWVSSIDFLSSKNFTHKKDINVLHQKIKRAKDRQKQYIKMDNDYFAFTYSNGIGRGGKVLRIWSEPFKTQAEAEAFMESYTQERVDSLFYQKHPTLGSTQVAHPNTEYAAALSNTDSHKAQSSALCSIQSQHATTLKPISQTQVTTPTTLTIPHKIGTSSVLAQEQAKALS
uniref:hypothetical protein n=1 Tax=uncultured Helicobacter sp. TaxID=175537 RepID=UPI00261B5517